MRESVHLTKAGSPSLKEFEDYSKIDLNPVIADKNSVVVSGA